MNNTCYNDIDLKKWKDYENIKTNTFWDSSVNFYEQIYNRYSKVDDTVLLINCQNSDIDYKCNNRNLINVEFDKHDFDINLDKIQLIIFNCLDINYEKTPIDFNIAKKYFEKYLNCLEKEHFIIFITCDIYQNNEIKLLGYEQVKDLLNFGLTLKSNIIVQKDIIKGALPSELFRYRALMNGYNVTDHFNIFVMQK